MKALRLCCAVAAAFFLTTAVPTAWAGDRTVHVPPTRVLSPSGGPVLPTDYQGIWNYTLTVRDCETMFVFITDTGTDTLCADDAAVPDSTEGSNFSCEGTITGSGYNLVCSGTEAIDDTCSASFDYEITATLNGNNLSYVGIFNTTYDRCGEEFPASCFRYEYTAVRVGNANTACATPVESTTWGYIKSRHR